MQEKQLHTSHIVRTQKRPTLTSTYRALPCRHHHRDWDKAAADGSLSGKKFLVRLFIINTLILMSMVVAVQVHCLCLRCISLHSVRRLESWHDGAWTILEKALKKWEFSHSGGRMLIISHIQLLKSPIRFFINAFSHFCMTEGSEV